MATIVQINGSANWGSTGRIAEEINKTAINDGWNAWIAYGRKASESASQLIRIGCLLSNMESLVEARIFDNDGLSSRLATISLIKRLRIIRPDIVHLHNLHGYHINYQLLFDYLKNNCIKVVWTIHDCWPFTGHCSHFPYKGCEKWKFHCDHCPAKQHYPSSWIIDGSKRNYERKKSAFLSVRDLFIVPVSAWMGGLVNQSFLSVYPSKVIYNGIDVDKFVIRHSEVKDTLNISGKTMLLGVATAWSKSKGLLDYIELAKLLDPNRYQIVLVGLTTKQIKSLPESIIGIDIVSPDKLVALYNAADIVLNLSYAESFGLTTIEGMSCGTPGIVYNKTASPELVTPNTGIVVNAGSISELVSAIQSICEKGKNSFIKPCRERVESTFNAKKQYEKYLDLYNSLLTIC